MLAATIAHYPAAFFPYREPQAFSPAYMKASRTLARSAIAGFAVNARQIAAVLDRNPMLVTALAPEIGYDRAAAIAKAAHTSGSTLREAALAAGVSAADFDRLVRPEDMVGRGN